MRDEDSVKQAFEAQASSADESRELCDIFGLDSGGRHDDRRDRLLSLLSGPPSRRRIGWLDLLLQVHAAGAQSFDELEPSDLEAAVLDDGSDSEDVRLLPGSVSLLLDLRDRLPASLDSAPSYSVLPDLVRADQDGRTSFSLRAPLAAPAVFAGQLAPGGSADASDRGEDDPVAIEQRVRAALLRDIRDGKLVVPSDTSVASQRSAFAFDLDPKRLILLDVATDVHGDRKSICGPVLDDPDLSVSMDGELFHRTLFESKITKKQVDAINRRNLLPDGTFKDAPELSAADVTLLGGKQAKPFRDHDSRRIEQQALLKPVQCSFRALAGASEAFLQLQDVLDQLSVGSVVTADAMQQLQLSVRCVEDVIAAESDAVLLASSKITELQIQRNEIFIRTTAEEPEYHEERASGKSSLNIQDTSDLLAKAEQVRKVKKDRQALRSTRRPKQDGDFKRRTDGKERKPNRAERQKRADQSKRDKESSAADKKRKQPSKQSEQPESKN